MPPRLCKWRRLLLDDPGAGVAAAAIVRDVRRIALETRATEADPTLASGDCGLALLLDAAARASLPATSEDSCRVLNHAIHALAEAQFHPSLYSGFTGVAWTAAYLGHAGDEELFEEIDGVLLKWARNSPPGDYDLITGLVGLGVYALERLPSPAAVDLLHAILDRIAAAAVLDDAGARWFTPPRLVGPQGLKFHPDGYYNLGVAHGVPGVIGLLGGIWAGGLLRERVEPLLRAAVEWVLAQRLGPGSRISFPYAVSTGVDPTPSRLGWCYGDPGIAAVLLNVARAVGVADWRSAAIEIALGSVDVGREVAGVHDAGLCHGAMGLSHLYNRLWQGSGVEEFQGAARKWAALALAGRTPGSGVGGYVKDIYDPGRDEGFLGGASGIGLALVAATTEHEPSWDRLMLLSYRAGSHLAPNGVS